MKPIDRLKEKKIDGICNFCGSKSPLLVKHAAMVAHLKFDCTSAVMGSPVYECDEPCDIEDMLKCPVAAKVHYG
jgi:hypothetical protein